MSSHTVRFWQGFSLALGITLAAVLVSAGLRTPTATGDRLHFAEIDVERINVVEADGTVKLVIANRERAPDQIFSGQSQPRAPNNKSPGITFFDDAGDEAGGLKIRGDRREGPSARRHLTFDQQEGDQALALVSDENEEGRTVGLTIWDRPDLPLLEVAELYQRVVATPAGPERSRLESEFDECCRQFGPTRLFLGKRRSRDVLLALADDRGRERLRMIVTAAGDPKIQFLDEEGRTLFELPRAE